MRKHKDAIEGTDGRQNVCPECEDQDNYRVIRRYPDRILVKCGCCGTLFYIREEE